MGKGIACECWQNEFLFEKTAICTCFGAVCRSMERVLVLNSVRFGAKCKAFWCLTQGKMLLNVVRFAAKRKSESIKIHRDCINKTF